MSDLIERLQGLSKFKHSDFSVGDEAADHIEALQAKLDAIMLEYCPNEMPPDQFSEWAKHQVAIDEDAEVLVWDRVLTAAEQVQVVAYIKSQNYRRLIKKNDDLKKRIAELEAENFKLETELDHCRETAGKVEDVDRANWELRQEVARLTTELAKLRPPEDWDVDDVSEKDWKGVTGSVAWHLIDRHAEGWGQVGDMMDAWRLANEMEEVARLSQAALRLAQDNTRLEAHVRQIAAYHDEQAQDNFGNSYLVDLHTERHDFALSGLKS